MPHFFDLNPESLGALCAQAAMPAHAGTQIMEWVYRHKIVDPARMTNLSLRHRTFLADQVTFDQAQIVRHLTATDDTQKLLLQWPDRGDLNRTDKNHDRSLNGITTARATSLSVVEHPGDSARQVECVMIPTDTRRTACISSQIGCPVGCRFCASGLGGLDGNLTAGQIVEQVHRLSRLPGVDRISNVVFMGMGEPLANFGAVTTAIRTINADWGMGISARKITVSTVGLPASIRRLVGFEIPVTLALSLHAPNDEIRRQVIPWAEYATITELLDACDEYFQKSGREITLEYLLLHDVNDRPEHARELADVAKRLRANVNLIRYNEVAGLPYQRPSTQDVREFQRILREAGVNAHIRASRGRDISAACGQLRHEQSMTRPD